MNIVLPDFSVYVWVSLSVFILSFAVQFYYYIFVYSKLTSSKTGKKLSATSSGEALSVIICANDKSSDLEKNLPSILTQNYPEFEVIVVNDGSSDASEDILNMLQKQYPNLEVRNLVTNNLLHGKSVALGVGIKAAKYDKIVLCDVDCTPDSADWLQTLSKGFSDGHTVVNAYTRFKAKKFMRADVLFDALNSMGQALRGKPYTLQGSNMAFDKKLFFERKGFDPMIKKNDKIEAVFFNAIANAENTCTITDSAAVNCSSRSLSFGNWRKDKSRYWYSQRLFRRGTRNARLPEMLSRLLFFLSIPLSIYFTLYELWFWITICTLTVVRLVIQISLLLKTQKQFNERGLLLYSIWWDIISLPAYLMVFLSFGQRKMFK